MLVFFYIQCAKRRERRSNLSTSPPLFLLSIHAIRQAFIKLCAVKARKLGCSPSLSPSLSPPLYLYLYPLPNTTRGSGLWALL